MGKSSQILDEIDALEMKKEWAKVMEKEARVNKLQEEVTSPSGGLLQSPSRPARAALSGLLQSPLRPARGAALPATTSADER